MKMLGDTIIRKGSAIEHGASRTMAPDQALNEYLFATRLNSKPMPHPLKRHILSNGHAVTRIEADCVAQRNGELEIFFGIDGKTGEFVIPAPNKGARHDELWRTTCVELFIRESGAESYWEFNFSPSTDWAAYRFTGYRSGRQEEKGVSIVDVDVQKSTERLEMHLVMALDPALKLGSKKLKIGLSAIIEEIDGSKSFWALKHPPGDPDFHNKACFTIEQPKAIEI